jgi:predicted dehydrogenase
MSLRIGVIGASYAAATHLPAYAALAADGVAEVVAVATSRRETADEAARRFGVPTAHVGFEALCADPDVDLVDVVTRPSRHRAMAEAALAAGKHVLVEAPLAPTVTDGEALEAAAGKASRAGVVDMQSRFWPGLAELHRLVHDGYLGRVQNIVATAFYPTFTQPAAVASSGWCADARTGASSLRVHGLHTTDLIRWVFGELTGVRGTTATRADSWPGPDGPVPATSADSAAYTALIDSGPGAGAVCSLHTSWVAQFGSGWHLTAYGSDGTLVASADGHTGHFPIRLDGARTGDPGLQTLVTPDPALPATYPFSQLIRTLATQLTTSVPPTPGVPPTSGVPVTSGVPGAPATSGVPGTPADPAVPTFTDGLAALRVADAAES